MGTIKGIRTELNKYRPDQLRDHGRFAYEGGSKFELKDRPVKSTRIEDTRLGELIAKDTEFIDDKQLAAKLQKELFSDDHDPFLKSILIELGYDAKPILGSKEDIEQAVKEGGIDLWRGVSGTSPSIQAIYADSFKRGDLFVGEGFFGSGTYATPDTHIAATYAGIGRDTPSGWTVDDESKKAGLVHMALRKGAKVIDANEAFDLARKKFKYYSETLPKRYVASRGDKGADPLVLDKLQAYARIYKDPGRAAALEGYDAISSTSELDGAGIYVILNRGALVVEQ